MEQNPFIQIAQMGKLAESVLKSLQTGEGFGLSEEQKTALAQKVKEEGLDKKIEDAQSGLTKAMNDYKEAVKKMNTQTPKDANN